MAYTPGKTSEIQLEEIVDATSGLFTKFGTLGQKTMSGSAPVVIASDQSTLPVSGTLSIGGTVAVTQSTSPWVISGTVTANLGTIAGIATETTLSALNAKHNADFGASSGGIRVASLLGNASGAALFGAGTTTSQVLRVVLPTDQSAIPASQSGTWNITNVSGTVSLPTGAATSANQSTEITALQLIDDLVLAQSVSTSGKVGVMSMGSVTTAAPSYTTGNLNPLSLSTAGNLRVDGSSVTQPVSGTVTANQGGTWNVGLSAGSNTVGSIASITTSITPGTAAANLGKAEDAAHASGDTGVMSLAVRTDSLSSRSGTDGDYEPLKTDSLGQLYAKARSTEYGTANLPNFYTNVIGLFELPSVVFIDPVALATAGVLGTGGLKVSGDIAHDAVDGGNPIKIGGKSQTEVTQPSAVSATGDRVDAFFDLNGFHHVKANATRGTMTTLHSAVTFNNSTTSSNSSSLDVTRYRALFLYLVMTESGNATSLTIVPQFSPDAGTTWCDFRDWEFADLVYITGQMPLNECLQINAAGTGLGRLFRLRAVATGTAVSDTITLTSYVEGIA